MIADVGFYHSFLNLDEQKIKKALEFQEKYGGDLGSILLSFGDISEEQYINAQAELYHLRRFDATNGNTDFEHVQKLFSQDILKLFLNEKIIPYSVENNVVFFLTSDPTKTIAMEVVGQIDGLRACYVLGLEREIRDLASKLQSLIDGKSTEIFEVDFGDQARIKELATEAPVIKFVNSTIGQAVDMNASDVHIEPYGNAYRIRYRIDGVLYDMDSTQEQLFLAVVSRLKLLAGLDIAERRLPQDGKIETKLSGKNIDIRVATFPTVKGEGMVMRLLYKENLEFKIEALGVEKDHESMLIDMIHYPYGLILVTGPTGSGKTTTLYTALSKINNSSKKIITVEDPVEYQIDGINQIQVKPEIDLTFSKALRSIVRQDPDILMIGEIRDVESAEIAIHSALTGHLVFSTLHTNDAPGALFRLLEMGVQDYLLNAALLGVVGQRLVRRVCSQCGRDVKLPEILKRDYDLKKLMGSDFPAERALYGKKGEGCLACSHTGFSGRIAVFEMFKHTEDLKEIFIATKNKTRFLKRLKATGFRTMREDGIIKVLKGITTFEEVLGVI